MLESLAQYASKTAAKLFLFAVVGTGILAYVFEETRTRIAQSIQAEKMKLVTQIVPRAKFDNDPLQDTLTLPPNPQLGTDQPSTVYRARLKGAPSMVILEVVAPDGYSGKIRLIVAIDTDATISGVRVIQHKETPGLGDYIDIAKGNWIKIFEGASHTQYAETDWQVKKDDGQFDYMTGATITPRAIVKAVHKALHYYEENQERLFVKTIASKN